MAVPIILILGLVQAILPHVIRLIESLMSGKPGEEKKAAALGYITAAIPGAEPAIVGPMVDGMVALFNTTTWVDEHGTKFEKKEKPA